MTKETDMIMTIGLIGGGAWILYNLSKGISQIGQGFGTAVGGLGSGVSDIGQGVGNLATGTSQNIVRVERQVTDFTNTVSKSASDIVGGASKIVTGAESAGYDFGMSIYPYAKTIGTDIGKSGTYVSGAFNQNVKDITGVETNLVTKASNLLTGGVNLGYSAVRYVSNAAVNTVKSVITPPSTNKINTDASMSVMSTSQLKQVQSRNSAMSLMSPLQIKQVQTSTRNMSTLKK